MVLTRSQGWDSLATLRVTHRPGASAPWVHTLAMQSLTTPLTPTVPEPTFSQISGLGHMKKIITFKIKFVICNSGSISKRKYFSGSEIREAFSKEVTSQLGPKVKAVLVCGVYSSRGSGISRLMETAVGKCVPDTQRPLGWNQTPAMVGKLPGVGMTKSGRCGGTWLPD